MANSEDQDEMQHDDAFHQGQQCLLKLKQPHDQEKGVPHGGVLYTALFNISTDAIVKSLEKSNLTDFSVYVDDFFICYRS